MVPVVDGLEDKYIGEIEVQRKDASGGAGLDVFRSYSLRGHPAYVLLQPSGEVVWTGLGVLPIEMLDNQVQAVLGNP